MSDDFDSSLHELKFHCSECTERFSSESNLKVHLELRHDFDNSVHEEKELFKCEICYFKCTTKQEMKKHEDLIHDRKNSLNVKDGSNENDKNIPNMVPAVKLYNSSKNESAEHTEVDDQTAVKKFMANKTPFTHLS